MFHHIVTYCTMSEKHRDNTLFTYRSSLAALGCIAAVGLAGCSSLNADTDTSSLSPVNWITPYKVDVIQGNFISKEQVALLKVGMSRAQVKDVLGTPLVTSLFHEDRWDYVFTLQRQGIEPQSFKYAVFFKSNQLARFEGDTMPSNAKFIASLANSRKIGRVPVLEATQDQLEAAQKPSAAGAAPVATNPAAAAPSGTQPATYPPLESVKR